MSVPRTLGGEMLIAGAWVRGSDGVLHGVDPTTEISLEPAFGVGGRAELERAAAAATDAFDVFRATSPAVRTELLERIAAGIDARGDVLVDRVVAETGLPRARVESERGRTTGQLRLFARLLRAGRGDGVRIDHADPHRSPLRRPDVRQRLVPVGPVAVFGSSNFPLAFSAAGGDTAAALAAGCPVIVKVHDAHPGTAMLVSGAISDAVGELGLPGGVFSALIGSGNSLGAALVAHPAIAAVGFTGSRAGGLALTEIAHRRPVPIPVYAEMSSVNPVFVLPSRATAEQAAQYVASFTLGSGQFCTNPGLVFVPAGDEGDAFVAAAAAAVRRTPGQTMLTSRIRDSFEQGVAGLRALSGVEVVATGTAGAGSNAPAPVLLSVSERVFAEDTRLQGEVFGAMSLLVRYADAAALPALAARLEGQLTATVHAGPDEADAARALLPVLERRAGRILFEGWPTGVEVNDAMVHGGPYPATTDARTTSVGTLSLQRFQRPVAYQDAPEHLRPAPIADAHAWGEQRVVDGGPTPA